MGVRIEDKTHSDGAESTMSSDDSARLSNCSTLAEEIKDSGKSDSRGGFKVPRKCDTAKITSTVLSLC